MRFARRQPLRFTFRPFGGSCGGATGPLLTFFVAIFVVASVSAHAAESPTEYQVKAAYIFNFLKFVEWPEDSPGPRGKWVVGFVGDSPVGAELGRLFDGKEVLGRTLQVKKLQAGDSLRGCHILFISESEKKRLSSILAALRGSSVLTVGDTDDFVGSGGMIQLFVEDTRVRMTIDVSAASRARLKISSKMLLLAHVVGAAERGATN
jgi:YfiR/HmsC-like